MPMNVQPIATLDNRINDIRLATAGIINDEILPNENKLWAWRNQRLDEQEREEARELRRGVQEKVKKAGLWAPHLPPEYGGMGLDFLPHAYMNEVLAYSVGAASLFGVVHMYSLSGLLVIVWTGFILALAYERCRSLWPCILAHSFNNLLYFADLVLLYR